ncbi:MAG: FAD-dependent monooxygenase [Proteobacteria bacterium]|nr:FAD-dependent monooxygenase [Pseudomonadota bacterium]
MSAVIKNVLIVGGGIGGLTAAVALARRGIRADIVEIKTETSVYGVGIIQPGNALRALDSLGLMQQCLAAGFPIEQYRYFDAQERELATLQLMRVVDADTPATNMIPRPTLHRILMGAAAEAGVTVRFGLTVDTLTTEGDEAAVLFSDGTRGRYDLVIGADGIRSQIRKLLFGEITPKFTGHGVWRFTTARPARLDFQAMYMGVGLKAGLVPLTRDTAYLLLVTNESENRWMPADRLAEMLRDHLTAFGGMVAEAREKLRDPKDVIYVPIEEIELAPPWHKGRAVLIGDAAHASSPHIAQGAAMAVEDAVVLAELAAAGGDIEAVLNAFEARRYPRCKFVQELSRKIGHDGNLSDPELCRARNERIRRDFATPQPRPHELTLSEPI